MSDLARATFLLQAKNYSGSGNWLDESGNSHDGTLVNSPTFNGDHFTLSSASSQQITIADHTDLDFADGEDFTLMVVARFADITPASHQVIVGKGSDLVDPGYRMFLHSAGNLDAWLESPGVDVDLTGISLTANEKFVGTLRRDDSTPEAVLFKDGTKGTGDSEDLGDLETASDFVIGAADGASPRYLDGDIYAVALWREALTDAEIVQAGNELLQPASGLMLMGGGI